MITDTKMNIDQDPDSERTTIDKGTVIGTLDYTEKKTETAAETTNDGAAMTTEEETAVATITMTVAVTTTTDTGRETGTETNQDTGIEKVDKPTGLLHATPLTTAVGLQCRVNQSRQQVVLCLLPVRYLFHVQTKLIKYRLSS